MCGWVEVEVGWGEVRLGGVVCGWVEVGWCGWGEVG